MTLWATAARGRVNEGISGRSNHSPVVGTCFWTLVAALTHRLSLTRVACENIRGLRPVIDGSSLREAEKDAASQRLNTVEKRCELCWQGCVGAVI